MDKITENNTGLIEAIIDILESTFDFNYTFYNFAEDLCDENEEDFDSLYEDTFFKFARGCEENIYEDICKEITRNIFLKLLKEDEPKMKKYIENIIKSNFNLSEDNIDNWVAIVRYFFLDIPASLHYSDSKTYKNLQVIYEYYSKYGKSDIIYNIERTLELLREVNLKHIKCINEMVREYWREVDIKGFAKTNDAFSIGDYCFEYDENASFPVKLDSRIYSCGQMSRERIKKENELLSADVVIKIKACFISENNELFVRLFLDDEKTAPLILLLDHYMIDTDKDGVENGSILAEHFNNAFTKAIKIYNSRE